MKRVSYLALLALLACGDDAARQPPDNGGGGGAGGQAGQGGATMSAGGAGGVPVNTGGSGGMSMPLPPTFVVSGIVVDENGAPVEGATVLQGGRTEQTWLSGSDGSFAIELHHDGIGTPGVVAGKDGYRMSGAQFFELPLEAVTIELRSYDPSDNPAYVYSEPGSGVMDTSNYCGHCHEVFTRDFQLSKHQDAASNPQLHDLYAGVVSLGQAACVAAGGTWRAGIMPGSNTIAIDKCYLGGGVLGDLNATCGGAAQPACDDPALPAAQQPTAFGACADCHAPGISGVPGGRDLHDATAVAFNEGVFCDVCHKIGALDMSLPPGVGAGLRMSLQRPLEPWASPLGDFVPLTFGPLLDVPNGIMGAVYREYFNEAEFCAGCHQQRQPALIAGDALDPQRWPDGLDVHTTYQEWLDGPYAQAGVPCQHCHMPPHFELTNSVDVTDPEEASITFGYARGPEDKREHIFRGPLYEDGIEPRLVDTALFTSIQLTQNGSAVDASVSVSNVGCGHAVPTGEPMRALVMIVEADGAGCGALSAIGGMTAYDAAGAHARGVEGGDVTTAASNMTWPAGAAAAQPGMVVRAVRPSGTFDDYNGIGLFADTQLTPAQKGLEVHAPLATASVVSVAAGQLVLDSALTLQPGDVIYLGDAASALADGAASGAFAGASGYAFARVLVDAAGARHVPHYRAVDMASDNRIGPGQSQLTTHSFDASGCSSATVRATVLYRPLPLAQAKLRGWTANDYIIASAQSTIAL